LPEMHVHDLNRTDFKDPLPEMRVHDFETAYLIPSNL
jgi:hypothetical protein